MTTTLSISHTAHIDLQNPVKLYRMSTPEHECPWGLRAVNLLNEKGIAFEDVRLTSQEEVAAFKAQHDVATTPHEAAIVQIQAIE